MRFTYHPLKDRFVLCNSWKDPAWTDAKSIRAGIDNDEKESRELVFGKNLIEIKQKTVPQLLVDEVNILLPFPKLFNNQRSRLSTHFTFFKYSVFFFGPLTSITITLPAYL